MRTGRLRRRRRRPEAAPAGWKRGCRIDRQGEAKMDHLMMTTGQLAGCMVFALLMVRGLVAIVYDFTRWTLERNGIDEDQ
jgi:hypothetical protein